MKRIALLFGLVFIAGTSYADTCASSLMPAFTANQAVTLCTKLGDSIAESLIPQSDNAIDLGSASKTWRTLYTGTSRIAKTSDILRVRQDAQRLFTWDASSDTAFTQTFGDGGTTAAQVLTFSASTADADDDSTLVIAGGGALGTAGDRGSYVKLTGNETATDVGRIDISSGNISGADVYLRSSDDVHVTDLAGTLMISMDGTTGTLISQGTSSLGWTIQAAANQACNTTCVTACVFGQETTSKSILACTDATADSCLCAGGA